MVDNRNTQYPAQAPITMRPLNSKPRGENEAVSDESEAEQEIETQTTTVSAPRKPSPRSPRYNRMQNDMAGFSKLNGGGESDFQKGAAKKIWAISIFLSALCAAICLDFASLVIQILPGLGGFLSSLIIAPLGWLLLGGFKFLSGKSINKKTVVIVGICVIIEFLPIINALPGFTLAVISAQIAESADEFISKNLN